MPYLTRGNSKLGRDIWTFNLPAGTTCPGMSEYCEKVCYAAKYQKRFPNTLKKYEENLNSIVTIEFISEMHKELCKLKKGSVVRIHVSGDFYNSDYITVWEKIIRWHPRIVFYAYTRSWNVPRLLPHLGDLRSLPNMTLIASWDPTMPLPPKGWRVAVITPKGFITPNNADPEWEYITCPEQTGKAPSCSKCKLCYNPKLRSITKVIEFKEH